MTTPALPIQTVPPPDSSAPSPVAPVIPASPAPDLSGMTQPGPQPNLGTATANTMAPFEQASQAALQKATAIANTPTTAPPQPHARLMAMINGLALGLSSFGTSLATKGQEGGEKMVADVQNQQAATKLAQQNAAREAKNQALQQQLTIASTNEAQANNVMLLASLPQKFQMQDIELKKGQQDLAAGSLSLASGSADFMSKWGMTPDQFNGSETVNPQDKSGMVDFAQQKIAAQAQQLDDPNDPYVAKAKTVLADPNATPQQIFGAMASVNRQVDLRKGILESQNLAIAGLPKNQQEAAAQLAAAQSSGDPNRIAKAQAAKNSIDATVQQERKFSSDLQQANNVANKALGMQNTLAQKGIEDVNKLWTDQQHGFSQTLAQASATKNAVMQAKNGSQLAASLEPAMTVLGVNSFAGVHRISPTEYEAAGPAVGSLYRRLNAALDKAGTGAVPQATLSEVNGIMDALVNAKYQQSLSSTRQVVANSGVPSNRIFVPSPDNYNVMTSLDKVSAGNAAGNAAPRQVAVGASPWTDRTGKVIGYRAADGTDVKF